MQTAEFWCSVTVAVLLFIGTMLILCVAVGEAGQALARRHGWQCPHCDYRPPALTRDADMLIHRVLEHEQTRD